jgi:hypothetical protein
MSLSLSEPLEDEEEEENLMKDLQRYAISLSRGTVQTSPRTLRETPPLENCSAVAWTIPLLSGSLLICSI